MATAEQRLGVVLEAIRVRPTTPLRRVAGGQTNEVWIGPAFVVRINPRPGEARLGREAAILGGLPAGVRHAEVLEYGRDDVAEWLLQRTLGGVPLTRAWPEGHAGVRREAVRQIAGMVRALHAHAPAGLPAAIGGTPFAAVEGLVAMCRRARDLPMVDPAVMDDVAERLQDAAAAFDRDAPGLVHGDLHFDNVLWDGREAALLDFERGGRAPHDLDLDILARFCLYPYLFVAEEDEGLARPELYSQVLNWFAADYPALFSHPRLEDRLVFYSLAYDVGMLVRHPPDRPAEELPDAHPYRRLLSVQVGGGTVGVVMRSI